MAKSTEQDIYCVMAGDVNYDILIYEEHPETSSFYDLLSVHSYRPLILQPTRVTSKSNTLIDNIFVNDISCSSIGGNITSSISDHFPQFCQTNIFQKANKSRSYKRERSNKMFNER